MLWHELSWPTIQSLDKETPVLIPTGSLEQHGHHLPLFVDTMEVSAIADAVHVNLADRILMTPTLWLGSSHHHKDFPGTISLPQSLYSQVIAEMARSILRAGFRRLFFLNGHGGNEVPAAQALNELVGDCDDADGACIAFSSWWKVAQAGLSPQQHNLVTPAMTHACEWETSMMLFLRPDLVKHDKVDTALPQSATGWQSGRWSGGKVSVYHRFARLTGPGHRGKPEAGTAEKGKTMFDAAVSEITAFLQDFATWPHLPKIGPV